MKYRRFDAKRDKAEPAIVEALEKAGWEVHRKLTVDLLCLKRTNDGQVQMKLLEVKTAQGKRNPKAPIRKDRQVQNEFCARWSVAKPTTPVEALIAVGEQVEV